MNQGDSRASWPRYYQHIQGRAPRPLCVELLGRIPPALAARPDRQAIDLGCGDGTESLLLLHEGWQVLAIDQQPEALALLADRLPPADAPRLQTQVARFEEVVLPPADLIYAGLSLPFCPPDHFPALWARIGAALGPGGWFAGHFFGERDDWFGDPQMTFLTPEGCRALFAGFEVETFRELERDGETLDGPHHFHAFEVIARRAAS